MKHHFLHNDTSPDEWRKLLDGDTETMITDYFNSGEAAKDMEATKVQYQPGDLIWWYDQHYLSGYAGTPVLAIFVIGGVNVHVTANLLRGEAWKTAPSMGAIPDFKVDVQQRGRLRIVATKLAR